MSAKKIRTPIGIVQQYTLKYPTVWEKLDELRTNPVLSDHWDHICYLPCSAAQAYLHDSNGGNMSDIEASAKCAELTALYIWRKDKVIYRLDHELAEVLYEQGQEIGRDEELPIEFLLHLPHDCIYIQTDIIEDIDGFFVWIEFDVNRQEFELRIQLVKADFTETIPYYLHLSGKTLQECVDGGIEQVKSGSEARRFLDPEFNEILKVLDSPDLASIKEKLSNYVDEFQQDQTIQLFATQVILYLVSENREVQRNPEQAQVYRPVSHGSKIKDKHREIDIEDVGVRIGATLRKYKQSRPTTMRKGSGTGSAKRPHVRRGHWHHYWTGKKDGSEPRVLKLNWVAPTVIHEDLNDENTETNIVTIFPVKE